MSSWVSYESLLFETLIKYARDPKCVDFSNLEDFNRTIKIAEVLYSTLDFEMSVYRSHHLFYDMKEPVSTFILNTPEYKKCVCLLSIWQRLFYMVKKENHTIENAIKRLIEIAKHRPNAKYLDRYELILELWSDV